VLLQFLIEYCRQANAINPRNQALCPDVDFGRILEFLNEALVYDDRLLVVSKLEVDTTPAQALKLVR
jgi:hypothetical protein